MEIKSSLATTEKQESISWKTERSVPTLAFQNLWGFRDHELMDLLFSVGNQPKSMVFL